MAVNEKHPEYLKNLTKWQLMRDALAGEVAKEKYVPKLSDQEAEEYSAYVGRAEFYNATARTQVALTGLLFAKPPKVELPEALKTIGENISLDDDTLEALAKNIADECLSVGRCGVLVDLPSVEKADYSKLEAERLNLRAYATLYKAENIINWKTTKINGSNVTSLVVLAETYAEPTQDEFVDKIKTRYRVLDLHEGYYRQRVFSETKAGNFEVVSEIYPSANGQKLEYLPFTFFNVNDLKTSVEKPPLLDLAKVNISHFRSEVDLEHGTHFTALPTPYVTGYQGESSEKLKIGSTAVWVINDPSAKVGFLEFSGAGLSTLENRIAVKEKRMSILGARLLLDEKKTAEATETLQMRKSGENAVLTSVASTISEGIVSFLKDVAFFENIAGENLIYEINTDYNLTMIEPQLLAQIIAGIQSGDIPNEVLYDALLKGELMPKTIQSYEDYQAKLEQAAPQVMPSDEAV
uniref:Portal n=1 Tax=Siphoviridae sp. ctUM413 TaxID=2827879 RepID=A0A8S5TA47_9CAUD|nr:MAG TPA: portal [Siphoviridae sp. ctUM413]